MRANENIVNFALVGVKVAWLAHRSWHFERVRAHVRLMSASTCVVVYVFCVGVFVCVCDLMKL